MRLVWSFSLRQQLVVWGGYSFFEMHVVCSIDSFCIGICRYGILSQGHDLMPKMIDFRKVPDCSRIAS